VLKEEELQPAQNKTRIPTTRPEDRKQCTTMPKPTEKDSDEEDEK